MIGKKNSIDYYEIKNLNFRPPFMEKLSVQNHTSCLIQTESVYGTVPKRNIKYSKYFYSNK